MSAEHGFGYNGNIGHYLFFTGIVASAIFIFAFLVNLKKKKEGAPKGIQNIGEYLVEFLANLIEPVLGEKLVPIALPFLGTFFVYILVSNFLLIVPHPLGNPPTGDISVTLALAFICVFGIQLYNIFVVNGIKKTIKLWLNPIPSLGSEHGDTGEETKKQRKSFGKILLDFFKSLPMKLLLVVFIVLKVVDNLARLLSLSLRLFGNIYGEHTILAQTMEIALAKPVLVVTLFIPLLIVCFDVLVMLIQAIVFTNLSLFYMKEEWAAHD